MFSGLARLGVEPMFIVSVADALSTRPLIGCFRLQLSRTVLYLKNFQKKPTDGGQQHIREDHCKTNNARFSFLNNE